MQAINIAGAILWTAGIWWGGWWMVVLAVVVYFLALGLVLDWYQKSNREAAEKAEAERLERKCLLIAELNGKEWAETVALYEQQEDFFGPSENQER